MLLMKIKDFLLCVVLYWTENAPLASQPLLVSPHLLIVQVGESTNFHFFRQLLYVHALVSDQDFQPLYEVAEVPVCEDRVCVNITIIDDSIVEDTETFYITLERNARLPFRRVIFLPNNSKSRVNLFDDESECPFY